MPTAAAAMPPSWLSSTPIEHRLGVVPAVWANRRAVD
jgi:hypothetical protein